MVKIVEMNSELGMIKRRGHGVKFKGVTHFQWKGDHVTIVTAANCL